MILIMQRGLYSNEYCYRDEKISEFIKPPERYTVIQVHPDAAEQFAVTLDAVRFEDGSWATKGFVDYV